MKTPKVKDPETLQELLETLGLVYGSGPIGNLVELLRSEKTVQNTDGYKTLLKVSQGVGAKIPDGYLLLFFAVKSTYDPFTSFWHGVRIVKDNLALFDRQFLLELIEQFLKARVVARIDPIAQELQEIPPLELWSNLREFALQELLVHEACPTLRWYQDLILRGCELFMGKMQQSDQMRRYDVVFRV